MKSDNNYVIYTLESIRKDYCDKVSRAILALASSSASHTPKNSTCVEKDMVIGVLYKFIEEQKSFNHFDVARECRKLDATLAFDYEYVYYIVFSEFAVGKFGWAPQYKCTYEKIRMTDGSVETTLVYSPRRRIKK